MASARSAWGIDIGNRALKAVKLVREGDQLRVDDFELIEHENVLSNAGDNREQLIQTALANFVQRHSMKGSVAAIGVAGQSSFARFIKLPPVEEKKIPEIVRFEAIQQIPFPLDDVEWSYQLFRSAESPDVEVGIFAMRKDLVGRHIQFFTDFDMNVQVVQMNPLAVYNAVYYDNRLKGTTMIIDLGAENTDLIICDTDSVWMRSIPIGGNNFTETLVKAFKLPFAKAEDLKRNAATSKYARQIFQAMRPVFADLVAEIQRSVGFYASVHRDSRITKIIALGGTFRLPGLQKYLQQNLSLDVERLDNISAGAPADPKQAATFNENLLSVVGAYGLAIQAMGEGKITSSLLPAAIRREKLWREKTPIFAAAAAAFCLGTGIALAGYFLQNVRFEAASDQRANTQRVLTEAQGLESRWNQVQSAGTTERNVIQNVLKLESYRDLWRHLIKDVQGAAPKPQPQVVQGLLEGNADLIKQVPRDQRELVVIRSITTKYVPNLGVLLARPDNELKKYAAEGVVPAMPGMPAAGSGAGEPGGGFGGQDEFMDSNESDMMMGGGGGGGPGMRSFGGTGGGYDAGQTTVIPGGASDKRGYLITLKGVTPSANAGTLLEARFCEALKKIGPNEKDPRTSYKIEKAVVGTIGKIRENRVTLAELLQSYTSMQRLLPASGTAPIIRPAAGGALPQDVAPFLDRLTQEDIREDTEFTIVIAVVLDPAPYTPPSPEPRASAK